MRSQKSTRKAQSKSRSFTIHIEDLENHDHPSFEAALALFHRTFPDAEKIDRGYFVELLREKKLKLSIPFNYHFLVARRGAGVLGMCTGSYLAVMNMGFVGYITVDPKVTGLRIGTRLRSRLVAEFRRDARASQSGDLEAILGEVQPTNRWLDTLVRTRDVLPLDFTYLQPPLRKGSPPVALVLYLQPIGRSRRRIAAADLRVLLFAIYRRVYRVKFPLREPAFQRMIKELEGRTWIGRRKGTRSGTSSRGAT